MAKDMQSFEHMICERNVSLHTVMVDGAPWFRAMMWHTRLTMEIRAKQ